MEEEKYAVGFGEEKKEQMTLEQATLEQATFSPPDKRKEKENLPLIPGTEEEELGDLQIPRLRLLQSVSVEVEEGKSKPGFIRHSLSGEEWKQVQIIPICLRKSRIYFEKENLKGAPKCFSPDGKMSREGFVCLKECPFDKAFAWKDGEPPKCSKTLNFPCLILKKGKMTGEFASATFAKSSYSVGQKLMYFRTVSGLPYWAFVYELSSLQKKFKMGTAYVFDIHQVRRTIKQEEIAAEKIYENISKKVVTEEELIDI